MEIFCTVVAEDLDTGERRIAATAFFTFVPLDENKRPLEVPEVIPETEEEQYLFETGKEREKIRKLKRDQNKELITRLSPDKIWD
jgi:acyl-CoA hydrolase